VRCPRQQGVALITVLLILSILTVTGVAMLTRMNVSLHRSGNVWLAQQAYWYSVGVENWVTQILRLDAENSEIDSLDEAWATPVDYLPIDGGAISGRLIDQQGLFNLNSLMQGDVAMQHFARLVELVTEADIVTANRIAQATRDWIDTDINVTLPDGAEDNFYLGQTPPYRAANRPMASPSELRLVAEMTPEFYAALAQYVTALPAATAINVNTAPLPVLASLHEQLDLGAVERLAEIRMETPWQSVQAFLQEDALAGLDINAANLTTTSSYFLAAGQVVVDRGRIRYRSLFQRAEGGRTRLIAHSREVF